MSGSGTDPELSGPLRQRSLAGFAAERERLGWGRQAAVRWLDPAILAREAVQVAVSYAFGKFADKRETQSATQEAPIDCTGLGGEELWVDFLSDTGDGWEATQTMAWLLARPELQMPGGESLARGDLLLLGGDQVYPSADPEAYEDRFVGPFAAGSTGIGAKRPLFAIPGNHDWYDGLASFLRIFCRPKLLRPKEIGDWTTRQARSYWALTLRPGWHLWATDIQLDTYIDNRQLEYFTEAGERLGPDDRVILITAKPSWVKVESGKPEPESWRYLAYVERELVARAGAHLVLVLTGDLHHYSRYEPAEEGPVRITAGGGGAYLSPTHTLPDSVELRTDPAADPHPYHRREIYPRKEVSERLRWGILGLPFGTPRFGVVIGVLYAVLGAVALGALSAGDAGLAPIAEGSLRGFVDTLLGGGFIVLAALLALLLIGYTDLPPAGKVVVGLIEAAVHLALVVLALYVAMLPFSAGASGLLLGLVGLAACFIVGYLAGSIVFAATILAIHLARGRGSPRHANEVFAGQAIADHKNFLRLRFDRDGGLTVYPLGVARVCREWEFSEADGEARYAPREEPAVELIDGPLRFEPPGRR